MPHQTGDSGLLRSTKQPMISATPEIDCTGTYFTARATEVERLAGRVAEFLAKREIGRADTELGHPAASDDVPQRLRAGDRTVVEYDSRSGRQRR
jgi:hypothetical protein